MEFIREFELLQFSAISNTGMANLSSKIYLIQNAETFKRATTWKYAGQKNYF